MSYIRYFVPSVCAAIGGVKMYRMLKKRHAAVAVVDGNRVLIMQRSITDPWMPCKWALPGGGVDDGETFIQGLIRELKEETHLDITDPSQLIQVKTTENGKMKFYLANNIHMGKVDLEKASHGYEHQTHHWATKEELKFMDLVPELGEFLFGLLTDLE